MKDYLDHFTVVWQGTDPLLPPRRSKPPRWWTMGAGHALNEQDPKDVAKLKDSMRERRAYTRRAHGRVSGLQSGDPAPLGQSDTTGTGAGGHSPEPISNPPHHSEKSATEQTP